MTVWHRFIPWVTSCNLACLSQQSEGYVLWISKYVHNNLKAMCYGFQSMFCDVGPWLLVTIHHGQCLLAQVWPSMTLVHNGASWRLSVTIELAQGSTFKCHSTTGTSYACLPACLREFVQLGHCEHKLCMHACLSATKIFQRWVCTGIQRWFPKALDIWKSMPVQSHWDLALVNTLASGPRPCMVQ